MRGNKFAIAAALTIALAAAGVRVFADATSDFKDAFVKILDASKTDFKDALDGKPDVTDDGDKIYQSKIALPGVKRAEIWIYKDTTLSPSFRSKYLIEGTDKDEADKIYKDVVAKVKASIPDEWKTEEYTVAGRYSEGMEMIAYPPADDREVTVNMKRDRKSGEIDVSLIIDAKDR